MNGENERDEGRKKEKKREEERKKEKYTDGERGRGGSASKSAISG